MKKLPIGIQTFSELIQKDYVYIDKTRSIHEMISTGKYYFLARPRRFGKSLLVSTLESIFSGKRELFKGLAIDSLPYEWEKSPVIMISFADIPHTTPIHLKQGIKNYLTTIAQNFSIIIPAEITPGEMLRSLVMQLPKDKKAVLLIDEYDYAILKHIHDTPVADQMREVLKDFYGVIKGLDRYLNFVLLTGVSQFSKTSIFSGLNNLEDISLSTQYNTLLGYTNDEITHYFNEHLNATALSTQQSTEELLQNITIWYDGYQFTRAHNAIKMYNPFSVMLCLKKHEFSNYWFETGTPTFLINLLKTKNYPIQDLENSKAIDDELKRFEIDDIDLKTLMYQTGYLTIKNYNEESRIYTLGYPNKETIDSLGALVIKSMTHMPQSSFYDSVARLLKEFENNNLEQLLPLLTQLFAAVPYTIQIGEEKYYQTIFYILLKMLGAHIIVEQATNIGRIDAVLETKNRFFIIEFKINTPALKALQQIEEKKYYQPYESLGKNITLIGIAFDTTLKNVNEIKYKEHC